MTRLLEVRATDHAVYVYADPGASSGMEWAVIRRRACSWLLPGEGPPAHAKQMYRNPLTPPPLGSERAAVRPAGSVPRPPGRAHPQLNERRPPLATGAAEMPHHCDTKGQ